MTVTLDTEVTMTYGQVALLVATTGASAFEIPRERVLEAYPDAATAETAEEVAELYAFAIQQFAIVGNHLADKMEDVVDLLDDPEAVASATSDVMESLAEILGVDTE